MLDYLDLLRDVRMNGTAKQDRTGTGTLSVFGRQLRFDLARGLPVVTTKRVHFKSVIHELLWFLSGDTNIKYLKDNDVRIWDEWADENGDLGPVYGNQWRSWSSLGAAPIDQLSRVLDELHENPDSRRLVVSAWNVGDLQYMALEPCHLMFQLYVNDGRLSLHMYQRSADLFLGVPFNIASYALLAHMIAQTQGLVAGDLVVSYGDAHIYANHLAQVDLQLTRVPLPLPRLRLDPAVTDLFSFIAEDIALLEYKHYPAIPAAVAV